MLSSNRLRLFYSLAFLLHMATSKTCWPELVGKTADEAVQVIKDESGRTPVSAMRSSHALAFVQVCRKCTCADPALERRVISTMNVFECTSMKITE